MGSPQKLRAILRVVVAIVIFRHFDWKTFPKVTFVLAVKGDAIIFRMPHNKYLAAVLCHSKEKASLIGLSQNSKLLAGMDVLDGNLCMSGMWCQKNIIKASYQRDLAVHHLMPEQAKHFFIQHALLQAVEVI